MEHLQPLEEGLGSLSSAACQYTDLGKHWFWPLGWVSATHLGDLDWVPSSQFWTQPRSIRCRHSGNEATDGSTLLLCLSKSQIRKLRKNSSSFCKFSNNLVKYLTVFTPALWETFLYHFCGILISLVALDLISHLKFLFLRDKMNLETFSCVPEIKLSERVCRIWLFNS